jgi:hypothetical protein
MCWPAAPPTTILYYVVLGFTTLFYGVPRSPRRSHPKRDWNAAETWPERGPRQIAGPLASGEAGTPAPGSGPAGSAAAAAAAARYPPTGTALASTTTTTAVGILAGVSYKVRPSMRRQRPLTKILVPPFAPSVSETTERPLTTRHSTYRQYTLLIRNLYQTITSATHPQHASATPERGRNADRNVRFEPYGSNRNRNVVITYGWGR